MIFRPNDQIECNLNGEGKWYNGIIIKYREEEEDRTYDVAFSDEMLPSTVEKIPGKLLRSKGDPTFFICDVNNLKDCLTNFFGEWLSCILILVCFLVSLYLVFVVEIMPLHYKS